MYIKNKKGPTSLLLNVWATKCNMVINIKNDYDNPQNINASNTAIS